MRPNRPAEDKKPLRVQGVYIRYAQVPIAVLVAVADVSGTNPLEPHVKKGRGARVTENTEVEVTMVQAEAEFANPGLCM